jgi:hypothetical protein
MSEVRNAENVCSCGAYGGGVHTKSARCDGSRESPEAPPSVKREPMSLLAEQKHNDCDCMECLPWTY